MTGGELDNYKEVVSELKEAPFFIFEKKRDGFDFIEKLEEPKKIKKYKGLSNGKEFVLLSPHSIDFRNFYWIRQNKYRYISDVPVVFSPPEVRKIESDNVRDILTAPILIFRKESEFTSELTLVERVSSLEDLGLKKYIKESEKGRKFLVIPYTSLPDTGYLVIRDGKLLLIKVFLPPTEKDFKEARKKYSRK